MQNRNIVSDAKDDYLLIERKKTRRKFRIFALANSVICLVIGILIASNAINLFSTPYDPNDYEMTKLLTIYDIIKNDWYYGEDGITDDEAMERAIEAMANDNGIDSYLYYTPASEGETTYGIGINVTYYDRYEIVTEVYSDGPAENAGVIVGDIITAVNGTSIQDKSLTEIKALIQGEINTTVQLTLYNPLLSSQSGEDDTTRTVNIVRGPYTADYAYSNYGVNNSYARLKISHFSDYAMSDAIDYLDAIESSGIENIIIDLRDNGGGYVKSFKNLAYTFIDKGASLGSYKDKDGKITQINNIIDPSYTFNNIVILVNNGTASASESFAATLKDNMSNVTIVGETTYGKGIAQDTVTFSDGSSIKYTYAEYFRPNGNVVHNVGITPDTFIYDSGCYNILDETLETGETVASKYREYLEAVWTAINTPEAGDYDFDLDANHINLLDQALMEVDSISSFYSFSDEVQGLIWKMRYDEKQYAYDAQFSSALTSFN